MKVLPRYIRFKNIFQNIVVDWVNFLFSTRELVTWIFNCLKVKSNLIRHKSLCFFIWAIDNKNEILDKTDSRFFYGRLLKPNFVVEIGQPIVSKECSFGQFILGYAVNRLLSGPKELLKKPDVYLGIHLKW